MKINNLKNISFYLLLTFIVCTTNIFSQAGNALEFYNLGNKAFGKKNYKAADSLFTLSINLKPNTDTYLKRAYSRQKLNDKKGSCLDFKIAANNGNTEGAVLFTEQCSKIDTIYKDAFQHKTDTNSYVIKEIIERCDLIGSYDYTKYNKKGDILLSYYKFGKDTIYRKGTEITMPNFPGEYAEFVKFIGQNTQYPVSVRENGLNGSVWVSFIVTKTGKITNINLVKGMKDCYDCNNEALRVVSIMPNWSAGKRNNKPIDVYFRVPVNFKIQ